MSKIKLQTKLVKPNFAVILKQEQKNLIDHIYSELEHLDITSLKLDPDFLGYLCKLIENQVKTNPDDTAATKPSKMDILVEVIKKLFPLVTDAEVDVAKTIVEFLLKNKMIKKVPMTKIISFYLKKKFGLGLDA